MRNRLREAARDAQVEQQRQQKRVSALWLTVSSAQTEVLSHMDVDVKVFSKLNLN